MLISPLDWGLGHTTRCIPLIENLLANGHEVTVALSYPHSKIIQTQFPNIEILELEGYNIKYPKNGKFFALKIAQQIPRLLLKNRKERTWLQQLLKNRSFDLLISDNRYSFRDKNIQSVIITHQLEIQTGYRFLNGMARKIIYRYLNQFDACWVPDFEGETNLAGRLSHPSIKPQVPVYYLGPLTRFQPQENENMVYDLMVMISGPEPQRSRFEQDVLSQLATTTKKTLVVRGLPGDEHIIKPFNSMLEIHNHLDRHEMMRAILQSKKILCRSGYSTIMDLYAFGKDVIMVPTPGQSEQQYLAEYLDGKFGFRKATKNNLINLEKEED